MVKKLNCTLTGVGGDWKLFPCFTSDLTHVELRPAAALVFKASSPKYGMTNNVINEVLGKQIEPT